VRRLERPTDPVRCSNDLMRPCFPQWFVSIWAAIPAVVGLPDGTGSTLTCSYRGTTGEGADYGGGTGS
jgi:hypothetical protein